MTSESHYSYIFFLGTNPVLSRLELLHVLSPTIIEATDEYLVVSVPSPLGEELQDILGGSDRFAELLAAFPALPTAAGLGELLPSSDKKISVGLSGLGVDAGYLHRMGADLKAWAQEHGRKLRFVVPGGKLTRMNAAQVMTHRLDERPNAELTIIARADGSWSVARTVAVQDIRSYELRDTKRPARDAVIGMLPPKLAQIMLNLAVSGQGQKILDPFCGMGTILQEGWLADHRMVGSDASERMVRATGKNLAWLQKHFRVNAALSPRVFVHQADTRWSQRWHGAFDAMVTEPFLGKPVKAPLPPGVVERRMNELGTLYKEVFRASRPVLREGGRVVFALPAWRSERGGDEWQLFPKAFLDGLERLGYSRVQHGEVDRPECIYARPDALLGREITIWRKNNGS